MIAAAKAEGLPSAGEDETEAAVSEAQTETEAVQEPEEKTPKSRISIDVAVDD